MRTSLEVGGGREGGPHRFPEHGPLVRARYDGPNDLYVTDAQPKKFSTKKILCASHPGHRRSHGGLSPGGSPLPPGSARHGRAGLAELRRSPERGWPRGFAWTGGDHQEPSPARHHQAPPGTISSRHHQAPSGSPAQHHQEPSPSMHRGGRPHSGRTAAPRRLPSAAGRSPLSVF